MQPENWMLHRSLIWEMTCLISVQCAWAGLASCPIDAVEAVKNDADWIAPLAGGDGAVRALCDFILQAQGYLPELNDTFR